MNTDFRIDTPFLGPPSRPAIPWAILVPMFCLWLAAGAPGQAQEPADQESGFFSTDGTLQAKPFPAWMNELSTGNSGPQAGPDGILEPREPIDPDPQGASSFSGTSGAKKIFQFQKPAMPDFAEMRKKATKVTSQREPAGGLGSGPLSLDKETFSVEGIEHLHKRLELIEVLLPTLPAGPQRYGLEMERGQIFTKLAQIQALAQNPAAGPSSTNPHDKKALFPPPQTPLSTPVDPFPKPPPVASAPKRMNPAMKRFYRPPPRKSVLVEVWEERALEAGEDDDPSDGDNTGEDHGDGDDDGD
jgi:hypothetical protein